jgi:hypothetical protein
MLQYSSNLSGVMDAETISKNEPNLKSQLKKAFMFLCCVLGLVFCAFGQNNLTPDQIRKHAKELGVPYEDLKQFVDSYRVQTGQKNPNTKNAQVVSIQELKFMKESDKLTIGTFYRIQRVEYNRQSGKTVWFWQGIPGKRDSLSVDADFLVTIQKETIVDAIIGVKADYSGKPRELFLVEITLAK